MTVHHPEHLAGVDPRLVELVDTWARELDFDVTIIEGARTKATALANYAKGRTTPGPRAGEPGFPPLGLTVTQASDISKTPHGRVPAGAIDAMPLINGRIVWDEKSADWPLCCERLKAMQDIAERKGFVIGAKFPHVDPDHFEVPDWRSFPVTTL